jgi:hypothetical protein
MWNASDVLRRWIALIAAAGAGGLHSPVVAFFNAYLFVLLKYKSPPEDKTASGGQAAVSLCICNKEPPVRTQQARTNSGRDGASPIVPKRTENQRLSAAGPLT